MRPKKAFGYPADARIRKQRDFSACYENGKKYYCSGFVIYALERPGEKARTGVSVSRKVGNAVLRNRIKRLLREFFRLNFHMLAELDIIVVAKKNASCTGLAEIERDLAPVWRKLTIADRT